jgi:hypothetical protein
VTLAELLESKGISIEGRKPWEIVPAIEQALRDAGYEGLCNDLPCGCHLGDLFPCDFDGWPTRTCIPGYRAACPSCPNGKPSCVTTRPNEDCSDVCSY